MVANWLRRGGAMAAAMLATLAAAPALADKPRPWEIGFQEPAGPIMVHLEWMHNYVLLPIITVISLFVLGLLAICIFRFNARANPTPSRTTHHTLIEVLWTVLPIMILVGIAIPSFKLLYLENRPPSVDMTLKAVGNQWYWTYVYPDFGDMTFDANLVPQEKLKAGEPRLLTTDNEIVLPTGKNIRLLTTATDVIHSWAMPSFGVKIDAVPGRINEQWFNIDKPGMYYGQCSELCGIRHGFMPIMVRAVSPQEFDQWVKTKKAELGQGGTRLAAGQ